METLKTKKEAWRGKGEKLHMKEKNRIPGANFAGDCREHPRKTADAPADERRPNMDMQPRKLNENPSAEH